MRRWLIVVATCLMVVAPARAYHGKEDVLPAEEEPTSESPPGSLSSGAGRSGSISFSSLLKRLTGGLGGAEPKDEFLHPDVAFVPSVTVGDDDVLHVKWDIADGYYLYRDKFRFAVRDAHSLELGSARFPPGEIRTDEFFGRVEVFYDEVQATLPVAGTSASTATLDVTYQGCADAGLCYPPIEKSIPVEFGGAAVSTTPGSSP